jgi:hypothetical protein
MIGVAIGMGSSIDSVPAGFWGTNSDRITVTCNAAIYSVALQKGALEPTAYVALDPPRPGFAQALQDRWGRCTRFFLRNPDRWPEVQDKVGLPNKGLFSSGHACAKVALEKFRCKEIWLLGMDCGGEYCQLEKPIAHRGHWLREAYCRDAVAAWKQQMQARPNVTWRVWPKESALYEIADGIVRVEG